MISVGENKAVICKGDFHPAKLYKGGKKIAGYTTTEFSGDSSVVLENCYNDKVYDALVHGKNLLDVKKLYPDYVNDEGGISYTNKDCAKIHLINMMSEFKENTQYTFSADYEISNADNNRVNLYVEYTDGTGESFWNELGGLVTGYKNGYGSMTTEAGKTVQKMVMAFSTQHRTMDVKLTNMQLEEGATATEYEPPCRDATITVRGKNLLNVSKLYPDYVNDDGGITYTEKDMSIIHETYIYGEFKENTQYTFSTDYKIIALNNYAIVYIYYTDGTFVRDYMSIRVWNEDALEEKTGSMELTSEPGKTVDYLKISYASQWRTANIKLTNMQLEEGATATVYEPYAEPQAISFESGNLMADIPTFRGTTVLELESDIPATISGKYKRAEG